MMKPYYDHDGITIYHGDCREASAGFPEIDLVLSDPPYGMRWTASARRGPNSHGKKGAKTSNAGTRIVGDDKPFDPSPWLGFPHVILFGMNHFLQRLPVGTVLVWIKRLDGGFGTFLSDAELAWQKGGHGVYCYRDTSMRAIERNRVHPSQKPIPLLEWCIERSKSEGTILDPFMGSGSTLVAAKNLGRRAIGIEIEEKYCEIAVKRLSQMVLPLGGE